MFGGSKRQQPGKIRLPKQSAFPTYDTLKGLYEQAQVNRGLDVELGWAIPGSMKSYFINIKFDKVTPSPQWQVWEDDGRQSKLVSKFETSDLNLILDVVMMLETQNSAGTQSSGSNNSMGGRTGDHSTFQGAQGQGGFNSPTLQMQNSPGVMDTLPPGNTYGTGQFNQYQNQNQLKPTGQFQQYGGGQGSPLSNSGVFQGAAPQHSGNPGSSYGGTPIGGMGGGGAAKFGQGQGMPEGNLPSDFYSDNRAVPGAAAAPQTTSLQGDLSHTRIADVLTNIGMSKLTGLLEVVGDTNVAQVFVVDGGPKHAQAGATRGDDVIKELVTWRSGNYVFKPDKVTDMMSCQRSLQASIMEGTALADQLRQLEDAGLVYESVLSLKQKNLGDTELKLLLSKGHPLDFEYQKSMYKLLSRKKTFTDLLRDRPMEMSQWAPLLFNFLYCGILEIKPPSAARNNALDFLGDAKQSVQALRYNFVRPDTGIYSAEALLYFLEYEYYRYDAYEWPLAFLLFEFSKRKGGGSIAVEAPPAEVITTAAKRIELVKRPLDVLGHFEGLDFGLIMPNTKTSQAAFIANRILEALTNTPLSNQIDKRNLVTAFGIAGLPSDGEDLKDLLDSARAAKNEAKEGTFPIVLSRALKSK